MDESGRKKMCVFGSFSYNPEISFLLSYSAEERERKKMLGDIVVTERP